MATLTALNLTLASRFCQHTCFSGTHAKKLGKLPIYHLWLSVSYRTLVAGNLTCWHFIVAAVITIGCVCLLFLLALGGLLCSYCRKEKRHVLNSC